jgi:hypothetical protein
VPIYRDYFLDSFQPHQYALQQTFGADSFQSKYGFACAMSALWRVSPAITFLQPDLFSTILPDLHEPQTLVLGLYIRTGQVEETNSRQHSNALAESATADTLRTVKPFVRCAKTLEQELLLWTDHQIRFTRVAWLIVSDSLTVKQTLTTQWDATAVQLRDDRTVPRRIWSIPTTNTTATTASAACFATTNATCTALGRHSRLRAKPSTEQVVLAFLDWFLLGEAHLILTRSKFTFGKMASLRTAVPLYDVSTCRERIPAFLQQPT